MLSIADIELLFARHGGEQYSGEPVTQLEHALQTAQRAERDGADDRWSRRRCCTTSATCSTSRVIRPGCAASTTLHQYFALPFLHGFSPSGARRRSSGTWTPSVTSAHAPGLLGGLSADSKRSLELQGGVFAPTGRALPRPAQPPRRSGCACGTISPRKPTAPRRRSRISWPRGAACWASDARRWLDRRRRAVRRAAARVWNALIKAGGDKALDTALIHAWASSSSVRCSPTPACPRRPPGPGSRPRW